MTANDMGMRTEVLRELTENILPFWQGRMRDPQGGFFGGADCDGVVDKAAPRAAVVTATTSGAAMPGGRESPDRSSESVPRRKRK